jgi:hypothetical protein
MKKKRREGEREIKITNRNTKINERKLNEEKKEQILF